jgi:asparagine synthetase B (glutamine-hydrolysing)
MACRRHSVNRAPARPGAWCGPLMPGSDGVYFNQGYDRRFDSEPVSRELLANMAARLVHRGPDDTGIWTQGDVGFAHTRLSIIDVSGSQQPMAGAGGDTHLVFNGEILNYRELRAGLSYPFRTGTYRSFLALR